MELIILLKMTQFHSKQTCSIITICSIILLQLSMSKEDFLTDRRNVEYVASPPMLFITKDETEWKSFQIMLCITLTACACMTYILEGASVLDAIMCLNDDNTGAGWCLRSPRSLQVPKWQEQSTSSRGIYRRKAM